MMFSQLLTGLSALSICSGKGFSTALNHFLIILFVVPATTSIKRS